MKWTSLLTSLLGAAARRASTFMSKSLALKDKWILMVGHNREQQIPQLHFWGLKNPNILLCLHPHLFYLGFDFLCGTSEGYLLEQMEIFFSELLLLFKQTDDLQKSQCSQSVGITTKGPKGMRNIIVTPCLVTLLLCVQQCSSWGFPVFDSGGEAERCSYTTQKDTFW